MDFYFSTCTYERSFIGPIYLLTSSEKHALFQADEYHQSNMAVTFCAILETDFIFHTNTEIYV